jgi:RNA polymerase sigma-70 factor, ECF subfamily
MLAAEFTKLFEKIRPELRGYINTLVIRPSLAEEVVQTTFLNAFEALTDCPEREDGVRNWLFRIATNTAIDELRRHANWRETVVEDLRATAESDPSFVRSSSELIGTPETAAIAREHLATCFGCVLRRFPENKAAALLLKEVYGFALEEVAAWLGASPAQVKNWLQETRASMNAHYGATCALVTKTGVCHQCVELADFFKAGTRDPLAGTPRSMDSRLSILRDLRTQPTGTWHRLLLAVLEEST